MLVNAKQSGYRKTFDMKLDSLDEKTKRGYGIALRNFEKHGNIDPIKDPENQIREGWIVKRISRLRQKVLQPTQQQQ